MSTTPTLNAVVDADAPAAPEPVVGVDGAVDGVELPLDPFAGFPFDEPFDDPFEALPFELPLAGAVDGARRLGVGSTVGDDVDDEPLSWLVTA
jgi:hypothetical protein